MSKPKFNYKRSLVKTGTLDVAVSMGSDSVAISNFLSKGSRNLRLHYVNHGTAYAKSVETKFAEYLEFLKKKSKVSITGFIWGDSEKESMSKEAEFREFRYGIFDAFFKTLIHPHGDTNQLVVCHHLDDAVESYLMNAFTSASYDRRMPEVTQRPNYEVIRPFLLTPKQVINNSIVTEDLSQFVVEDPSNKDTSINRNFVRLELIPKIKERYTGIETVVKKHYNERRPQIDQKEILDTIP
jgi:tRNA(Ile)-lysidine synthase